MADGPLAGVFWRVLNALDYSDAGEFVAGGRGLWPLPRRWRARLIGIGFLGGGSGTGVKNPAGPFLDAPAVLIRQRPPRKPRWTT
jgi:hypothetical protein